ncbi:luciferase [Haloarcula sp. S1AR25-5A]|uniref:Luciferase n=1 Tax=Haloarcula terrestris TaxID=2950533 RepID=A0AAE4JHN8_9EURY|nr:luciferase [Haloarcula terrestris]MDS0220669.1 luciferase [Haloarcula terrestris]
MTTLTGATLAAAGIDAVALKPAEVEVSRATALDVDALAIDYEGAAHVPAAETIERLASTADVRVTTPVRADGYDPLGDDSALDALPATAKRVLVAGHGAYLSEDEATRAVAPRLRAAVDNATDPWVGTEGIERLALAVGGTQYELLSRTTARDVRTLRTAGFEGSIAVYAPLVLSNSEDAMLDAVGDYAARRGPVRNALPEGAPTDSRATGRARDVLTQAIRDYALVGSVETVAERTERLRDIGVDTVVGYPARGLDPVLS